MAEKKTALANEESQSVRSVVSVVKNRLGLSEARRIAHATIQNALAAGMVLFYSRGILGAVIRTMVGA